jgi:polar amino acid transport system substrate-binding protein
MSGQSWTRRDFLRRTGALSALTVVGGLGLSACSKVDLESEPDGGTLLDRLRDRGEVKVGFANEAPYSFINNDAEFTGEAVELAKVIFSRLGIPNLEPIPSEFGSLIAGLKVGLFDVIGAGMFILPERCAQVLFTNPDYQATAAFYVREGNPLGITTYADVAAQGIRLGTLIGAVEKSYATDNGVSEDNIVEYQDALSGLDAVNTDRVDAFSLTTVSLKSTLSTRPGMPIEVTEPFVPEVDGVVQQTGGAFAFLRDQQNIVTAFNDELAKLKDSGELLEIVSPFGFTEEELTDLTAEDLCQAPAA